MYSLVKLFIALDIFTVKRRLRDFRREMGSRTSPHAKDKEVGLDGSSGRVVVIAIAM